MVWLRAVVLCTAAVLLMGQLGVQNPYGTMSPSTPILVQPGNSNVMGSLRGANFNSTVDQPIIIPTRITSFQITSIIITNCNGQLSNAVGGYYQLSGKSGQPLVAASQTYFLSPGGGILNVPLASGAGTSKLSLSTIYLSLTTAQGSALLCDTYILGVDLT